MKGKSTPKSYFKNIDLVYIKNLVLINVTL